MTRNERKTDRKVQTVCLITLTACAVGVGLYLLRPVLVPFTLAVFLAFVLSPILHFLAQRAHIPRPIALGLTLLIGFGFISVLGGFVAASATRLAKDAENYEAKVQELIKVSAEKLPLERFGIEKDDDFSPLSIIPDGFMQDLLMRGTGMIAGILSQGLLVMLFVIFLLLGSVARTEPRTGIPGEIEQSVRRYIVTKVIVSSITGVLVYFVLRFLDIPYAIAFGAFAFMLNFIPSIGSIIATLLPLPVILLIPDIAYERIVLALVIPGIIQFTIGSIIEPKLLGDSLDLHPVVILLALIFWGMLWGPVGMLLAAPLTAITKIALSKLDVTAPVADLLAGRLTILELLD